MSNRLVRLLIFLLQGEFVSSDGSIAAFNLQHSLCGPM